MSHYGLVQVLIVEDNPDDAFLAEQALRRFGLSFSSLRVETERELRHALTQRTWDVVLCDQSMPLLDVPMVMEVLSELPLRPPVVMVTGTVGEAVVAEVMRKGIADVVLKDRLADRLGAVVEREVTNARNRAVLELRRLRTEAVLKAFASTEDWQEAARESLHQLALSFGAEMAFMSEISGTERRMHQVTSWSAGGYESVAAWLVAQTPLAAESLAGQAMMSGRGLIVRDLGEFKYISRFAAPLTEAGLRCQISQPFQAGGRTFIVTLYFTNSSIDCKEILAALTDISAALQPLLLRKIDYAELTLLRRALNCARSGVLITEGEQIDLPGPRIVYANRAASQISGRDLDGLLGETPRVLQGPHTDPAALSRIRRALKAAEPITEELQNHRPDGTPFWVELEITPVFEQERLTNFIAIQTDITQRKADERERLDREASFRLLFQSNPMPMWVCDQTTLSFLEVNNAAQVHYGWSREQFLQKSVHAINPYAEHIRAGIEASPPNTPNTVATTRHITASGEAMAVRVASHAITWQGRAAYLAVIWDVTEIERARDDLRRKNEALAALTDALTARTADLIDAATLAGMGTWTREFHPRRVTWSPETYAILRRDPMKFPLTEENIISCIHPYDVAHFREGYRRLRETGSVQKMEYRILRPAGEIRLVRELARPKHDAHGRVIGFAGVIQDITDQKIAADALLRSEKLITIGQITGGIAHDFNNLLNVIGLNLEQALDSPDTTPRLNELLEPALHAARRSGELTSQMLSYARRQSLHPVVIDVGTLISTLRPLLAHAVGDRHSLQLPLPASKVTAAIDPGQFENALMNITINARHALDDMMAEHQRCNQQGSRGRIEITVEPVDLRNSLYGQPDEVPPGKYARVGVTDTGTGIPPEILHRILEPFFTTKPLGTGSGLGLSMVYGFVHQSEGWLTIDSTVGQGTTMHLYFPLVEEAVPVSGAQTPMGHAHKFSGRVLLVEDRDDLRATMQRLLGQIGLQVKAVATGEAALDMLRSPEPVDLLFTDILLPGGIDGPALADAAVALRPSIKVLLTSGDAHQVDQGRLKWLVIPKPFKITSLRDVLSGMSLSAT